ncbi:MAG: FAD-dependent oxidoreductase [Candidatus Zhuqueibacterota bacterium]
MNRDEMIERIQMTSKKWDFIVIGGGATGMGVAIDAASRGYQTLLLEQADFGQGTSSRSTKLIHGGVRYLQQGNVSFVLEALKERGLLLQNAPHLVHNLPFIVPNYDWWESPFYGIGLKLYDILAGKHGFGHSKILSFEQTLQHLPTVETNGLRGGVMYFDGQFDDARLVMNMARTAAEQGATLVNYMRAESLSRTDHFVDGVVTKDIETGKKYSLAARCVINATGVYADEIRVMEDPTSRPMIRPSQGVHIVLDRSFLPGDSAIMVPHTDDGRVLFAIPWQNCVLVGTTDTEVTTIPLEPVPLPSEIDFLIRHAARYLSKDPTPADVLSAFAGLRPLVAVGDSENTAAISRDHVVHISQFGLVTITGGKWTTYRKMAEDTIDQAAVLAQLNTVSCVTHDLHIHGYHKNADQFGELASYGSDAPALLDLLRDEASYSRPLHPSLPYLAGEVVWAARYEMARTIDDFLSRRTRALLLNARACLEMAPTVAELLARELNKKGAWKKEQIRRFNDLAKNYIVGRRE